MTQVDMSVVKSRPRRITDEDVTVPTGSSKTITTLMPDDCRWPIGDPQAAGFHFCGKHKQEGRSYCEFHVRRASAPGRPRAITHTRGIF